MSEAGESSNIDRNVSGFSRGNRSLPKFCYAFATFRTQTASYRSRCSRFSSSLMHQATRESEMDVLRKRVVPRVINATEHSEPRRSTIFARPARSPLACSPRSTPGIISSDGEDDRSMTSADPAIFSRGRGGAHE